jgi:hypothetical protein
MTLIEELNREIDKEIYNLKTFLASGGAQSYDNYRQIVGKVEGLEWAKNHLNHITKKMLHEDED